jgi:hypothetical protein
MKTITITIPEGTEDALIHAASQLRSVASQIFNQFKHEGAMRDSAKEKMAHAEIIDDLVKAFSNK